MGGRTGIVRADRLVAELIAPVRNGVPVEWGWVVSYDGPDDVPPQAAALRVEVGEKLGSPDDLFKIVR